VPETDALLPFTTQVHALKSVTASIGAMDISALAAGLEAAGKTGDMAYIQENLPTFTEQLTELVGRIRAWEKTAEEHSPAKPAAAGELDIETATPMVTPFLRELATALKLQKANDIDRILDQLMPQTLPGSQADTNIQSAMEQISDEVLMAEYDKAGEILNALLRSGVVD
jgi:HPt (histidine-containing phosphotransfer) domain-containing protein